MSISLYDASVAGFLQTLGGVAGFLNRGLEHFRERGIDPDSVVETRLHPDMLPFQFQIQSVAHHSLGAIDGVRAGTFAPPPSLPAMGYTGLQKMIAEAESALKAVSPAEINGFEGKDVVFKLPNFSLPFVAEHFLLSFSIPNFHFHATTAYDILRLKGVPVGKQDYLGKMRMKT